MSDKFDQNNINNENRKRNRSTLSNLNKSWNELLSGFQYEDDIEIHSLEDLEIEDIDLSTLSSLNEADYFPRSKAPEKSFIPSEHITHEKEHIANTNTRRTIRRAISHNDPQKNKIISDADSYYNTGSEKPSAGNTYNAGRMTFGSDADSMSDIYFPKPEKEKSAARSSYNPPPVFSNNSNSLSEKRRQEKRNNNAGMNNFSNNEAEEKDMTTQSEKSEKKGKKKKKKRRSLGRKIFRTILILILLGIVAVGAYSAYVILTMPEVDPYKIYENLSESSVIYDDKGNVLESVSSSTVRTNVKYDELPENLVNAFVAIEDKTFFTHKGFNIVRIFGAIKESIISKGGVSGTSTITQQLARNLWLDSDRSMKRKIREAYCTVLLERALTKEQIIEAYLNTIPLGYSTFGVQAASQAYFGCDVGDLTLAECATLASLPKAPTTYAPLKRIPADEISAENSDILLQDVGYVVVYNTAYVNRQHLVLKSMLDQGHITQSEYDAAMQEDMRANMKPSPMSNSNVSSYFTDYCIQEVIHDLQTELKIDEESAKDMIYSRGLSIYSTINIDMQKAAEEEFSSNSNFPNIRGLKRDGNGNILNSKNSNIMLYSKSTYFNNDGTFTLQPDEFQKNANGDLVILTGKRLNLYSINSGGKETTQIEFKNLYTINDGVFYSINGGYLSGIDAQYISKDSSGNAVISADFINANPEFFIMGGDTVSIGPDHYTLRQETIQPQGSMVVTDFTNGQIKVMIGGRSLTGRLLYNRSNNPRQPGSSIKPIAVYGPAIQSGVELGTKWTAGTTIEDSENKVNGRIWPRNWYTGYKGWVTLRTCVQQSINVTAVRLLNDIGFDYSIKYLKANGITTIKETGDANDMNPAALALGGMTVGISPIEMASAYGTFPNGGTYVAPTSYTKVLDSNGEILLEKKPATRQVYDEGVAYIMTDILRTTVTNGIAGKAAIGTQPVGGKTGTTTDNYDAWFVGFTPQFAASVWIGNDVNIELTQGSSAAAALWSKVMKRVCAGYEYGSFRSRPSNVYVGSGGELYVKGTSPSGPSAGTSAENNDVPIDAENPDDPVENPDNPTEDPVQNPNTPATDPNSGTSEPTNPNTPPTNPNGSGTATDPNPVTPPADPNGGSTTTPNQDGNEPATPSPPHGVVNDAA